MSHVQGNNRGYVPWVELLRPSSRAPLSDEERRIVLDRQVQVASRLVPLFHVAHLGVIAIIAAFVIPESAFRIWWTGAVVGVALLSMWIWLPRSKVPNRRAGRNDVRLLVAEATTNGILHGSIGIYCYSRIDADAQLLLTSILAGFLGAGALGLFTRRSVGLSWVITQTIGMSISFVLVGTTTFLLLLAVLWAYAAILLVGVLYQSASFIRRCVAEHAAEARMRIVELLLDDVEGGTRDWLWETDRHGNLSQVSNRFAEALGVAVTHLEGRNLADLIAPRTSDQETATAEQLRRHFETSEPFRALTLAVTVEGETRHLSLSGRPVEGCATETGRWRGVGSDITDARRHRTEITRLANQDELTGLANRRRFHVDLGDRVARRPPDEQVHLAIVDLDDFKSVNEALGHPAGDRLLAAVAERLAATAPAAVTCARIGGDEFALVTTSSAPVDWHRYRAAVSRPFTFDDTQISISGCLGHASVPTDADTVEDLVVAADLALYDAKNEGGDHLSAFDAAMLARARRRVATRQELVGALEHDDLDVVFQPQVAARSGHVVGFEALVRWQHPVRGLQPPAAFVTIAEQTGLINPIGERVFDLACSAARRWPASVKVAVNLSAAQLAPTLPETFSAIAARHGLPFSRLEFEVTESALVKEAAVSVLTTLRSLGATIAVDDFGTGYSSLAALRRLPVDQLKIDRSFIAPLDEDDPPARAMVTAIVELADALQLTTVAEGVETASQRRLIASLGCHAIQGFHEARPMPASEALIYLDAHPGPTHPR